jgi:hypothetical protein
MNNRTMNKLFHYIDIIEEILFDKGISKFDFRKVLLKSIVISQQIFDNYKFKIPARKTADKIYNYLIKQ